MRKISYTGGYEYQLTDDYYHQLPADLFPEKSYSNRYFQCSGDGVLIIFSSYAWDGPSGPAIDTKNFMRGSLVHDVLYQAMRMECLTEDHKDAADRELQRICREDGMSKLRAWWVYQGVKFGGGSAVKARNRKKIMVAGVDA